MEEALEHLYDGRHIDAADDLRLLAWTTLHNNWVKARRDDGWRCCSGYLWLRFDGVTLEWKPFLLNQFLYIRCCTNKISSHCVCLQSLRSGVQWTACVCERHAWGETEWNKGADAARGEQPHRMRPEFNDTDGVLVSNWVWRFVRQWRMKRASRQQRVNELSGREIRGSSVLDGLLQCGNGLMNPAQRLESGFSRGWSLLGGSPLYDYAQRRIILS